VPLNSAPISFPEEGRLIKCFHLCSSEAQDIDNKLKTCSGLDSYLGSHDGCMRRSHVRWSSDTVILC